MEKDFLVCIDQVGHRVCEAYKLVTKDELDFYIESNQILLSYSPLPQVLDSSTIVILNNIAMAMMIGVSIALAFLILKKYF